MTALYCSFLSRTQADVESSFGGYTDKGCPLPPGELGSHLCPLHHMLLGMILGHPARMGKQSTTVSAATSSLPES